MPDDRRLEVLRAIVEDYVATQEPVGSQSLLQRHQLGVSAATIRNDMAVLEDEGLISQPHTSAGRVPTDKGYRLFVDRIGEVKALSRAERRAMETFMSDVVDVEDVVQRSVRMLAQLTHQVAIVQYPTLSNAIVLKVDVVPIEGDRALVVLMMSSGRVEQRIVDTHEVADLDALRERINNVVAQRPVAEAGIRLADLADNAIVAAVRVMVGAEPAEQRFAVSGTANLARFGADFETTIRPILEALEEQVILLKLLGEVHSEELTVRIGPETGYDDLSGTAVVSAGYGGRTPIATLGTVGPTRMDYPATMASVAAVARYVGRIVSDG